MTAAYSSVSPFLCARWEIGIWLFRISQDEKRCKPSLGWFGSAPDLSPQQLPLSRCYLSNLEGTSGLTLCSAHSGLLCLKPGESNSLWNPFSELWNGDQREFSDFESIYSPICYGKALPLQLRKTVFWYLKEKENKSQHLKSVTSKTFVFCDNAPYQPLLVWAHSRYWMWIREIKDPVVSLL